MKHRFSYIFRITALVLIILISLLMFAGCKNSKDESITEITGSWLHKSSDGKEYYYTFYGENGGKMNITHGCSVYTGEYKIDGDTIYTYVDKGTVYSENLVGKYKFTYESEGGNSYLVLSNASSDKQKLIKTKKKEPSNYIKPDKDFKEDKALTGTWKYTYEGQGDLKLVFNSDGTMCLDMLGVEKNYGVYKVADSVVTISFYQEKRTDFDETYSIIDGKLNILGLTFNK